MPPAVRLRSAAQADPRPVVIVDAPPVATRTRKRARTAGLLLASLLNVVAAVAAAVAPLRRILAPGDVNGWWNYPANEWLINYGGGPVRRGLAGEVLRHLPLPSDRLAVTVLVASLAVVVPLLFAVLVQMVIRRRSSAWPLLLWGIPGGLLLGTWQAAWLPIMEEQILFATRKEYAFTAALLLLAIGLRRTTHITLLAALFGAAMACGALVHEALVMPFVVAGSALVYFAQRDDIRLRAFAVMWAPVLLALVWVASLPTPGNAEIGQQWLALDIETQSWLGGEVGWPMKWLGLSLLYAVKATAATMLYPDMFHSWASVCVFAVGWTLAALAFLDHSRAGRRAVFTVSGLISLSVFPMLVVGIDWGRFAVVVAMCTAIVGLGRQLHSAPPPSRRPRGLAAAILAAAVLVALLGFVGVPEAGPPLGGLREVPASSL